MAGYDHLNLSVLLNSHHSCRTVAELVLHVGTICEGFVVVSVPNVYFSWRPLTRNNVSRIIVMIIEDQEVHGLDLDMHPLNAFA